MQQTHDTAAMPDIPGAKIHILQSRWYSAYTDVMTRKCTEILEKHGAAVKTHIVPGCLEFPLAAHLLLQDAPADAVACIGVLMKGETDHYAMILESCAAGLTRVSLDYGTPIVNAILPVTTVEQAAARAGDDENNKGIEAALAAGAFITWRRGL